jgi:hypothetical protein
MGGLGTVHAADLKEGFMDTKWQTDLNSLSNFLKLEEKEKFSYFVNPTVVHVIDDVKIPQVIYGAYENKFFAVYIEIDTFDVYNQMKRYITEKYGRPKMTMQINPDRITYTWKHQPAKIKLKLNEETGKMKLAFYYTPLSTKVNEIRQEAFQEKTKRFLGVDKERAVQSLDLLKF